MARFNRTMRMNRPRDFGRVFRSAKRYSYGGLTVLTAKNNVGHPRLGLAVAKKHLKLATKRNQLKRIIRSSFSQNHINLVDIDIVVLSRPDIIDYQSSQVWLALDRHWQKIVLQWQKS